MTGVSVTLAYPACPRRRKTGALRRFESRRGTFRTALCHELFRIDLGLDGGGIARALHRSLIDERIQPRDGVRTGRHGGGARVFLQVIEAGGAGDRHDVLALREQPGQGELGHGAAAFAGHGGKPVEERQIGRIGIRCEARHGPPDVAWHEGRNVAQRARQKPRASGLKATKVAPVSRQASSTAISGLRVQSEYSVCIAAMGCSACALRSVAAETSDRPRLSTLPSLHQPGHRTHAFLDGHALVPAMQVIEVNDVGAQPPERGFAMLAQGFGPAVDLALALAVLEHTALARQHELPPPVATVSPISVSLAPKP